MCIETEAQCTLPDENGVESICKCLKLRLVQSTSRGAYSDVMYGGGWANVRHRRRLVVLCCSSLNMAILNNKNGYELDI